MIWYLSYADKGFKGGIVTEADSFIAAYFSTVIRRINPGGEVQGHEVPPEHAPDKKWFDRLLTREDIQQFWPDAKSIREFEEEEKDGGAQCQPY